MLVSVEGLQQGAFETEMSMLPRKGETIRIFYGLDAEVEGKLKMSIILLISMMADIKWL
jgi:hypothetical protein